MTINTRDPAGMTSQERMQEIAALLMAGTKKRHINEQYQYDKIDLSGLPLKGKHSCDYAENHREVK